MSKKIIDYKTLTAPWPDELDRQIQAEIEEGWQPYGHQFHENGFHQPMVKRKKRMSFVNHMQQDEVADLLDVTQDTLFNAVQNNHQCQGYDVHEWALLDRNGKIVRFSVPREIYRIIKGKNNQK